MRRRFYTIFVFFKAFSILLVYLIFISSILYMQDCRAQSYQIRKDLLQGHWWFNKLDAVINLDMNAKTGPYNPWNIHFEIAGDTCVMIRLAKITPDLTYYYDSVSYLIKLEDDRLMFFPIKKRRNKPIHTLKVLSLKNQTLTFEDYNNAVKIEDPFLLRTAKFMYTFGRHQNPDLNIENAQSELKGKWYGDYNFLEAVLHNTDSLRLSSLPKYYEISLSPKEQFVDTILRYRLVTISNDNIAYNDSTYIRPGSNTYGYVIKQNEIATLFDDRPRYYIIPQKKFVEIVIPQKTENKDQKGFPVYESKSTLFKYQIHNGELLLVRVQH